MDNFDLLESLQSELQANRVADSGGKFMPFLYLKDGDQYTGRILTDAPSHVYLQRNMYGKKDANGNNMPTEYYRTVQEAQECGVPLEELTVTAAWPFKIMSGKVGSQTKEKWASAKNPKTVEEGLEHMQKGVKFIEVKGKKRIAETREKFEFREPSKHDYTYKRKGKTQTDTVYTFQESKGEIPLPEELQGIEIPDLYAMMNTGAKLKAQKDILEQHANDDEVPETESELEF